MPAHARVARLARLALLFVPLVLLAVAFGCGSKQTTTNADAQPTGEVVFSKAFAGTWRAADSKGTGEIYLMPDGAGAMIARDQGHMGVGVPVKATYDAETRTLNLALSEPSKPAAPAPAPQVRTLAYDAATSQLKGNAEQWGRVIYFRRSSYTVPKSMEDQIEKAHPRAKS